MNRQRGMTLLEVLVALVVFALAGLAVMQTTAQQASGIGRMEEKILASWLADNQQVQLHLEKVWPEKRWSDKTVTFAGETWYLRWQGVDTELGQLRALEVEVRHKKEDPAALVSLRSYVVRE
ncbi:type II secretion system protein I (GspI) [Serratia fonticola]|jgi:general secretion pathway protein I|uniref:Type II secretion system protein I n=1 Tax=Serratia fonticola TaxID=47917 RepID=A0A542D4E3_SERFO|nr:type II secretion system minor pseudopilin GspI [Serratia fonticola]TQI80023.1 type II secretion system protein I (GspI) [Serratia fonticola]TQI97951.1 type II secretion system protein I (GspI) [Serratia fonticola]TVZ72446.1 type II secretion system protein I (GspI) [Serratia fonticola]